jgi:hypothetical protein
MLGQQIRVQAVPPARFWNAQTVEPRLCAIRRKFRYRPYHLLVFGTPRHSKQAICPSRRKYSCLRSEALASLCALRSPLPHWVGTNSKQLHCAQRKVRFQGSSVGSFILCSCHYFNVRPCQGRCLTLQSRGRRPASRAPPLISNVRRR